MYRNLLIYLYLIFAISAIKCLPTQKPIDKQSPAPDLQKELNKTSTVSEKSNEVVMETIKSSEQAVKKHQHALYMSDISVDDYKPGFLAFAVLSAVALMFFVFKSYRLRSSRAERKYGVQGDHSTQELTPLPLALEDANSDDEDQTIFELNRHHIVL